MGLINLSKNIKDLAKPCHLVLPKEIKTEFFTIDIHYDLLYSGRMRATLKTVRSPKGVENVIFNGGSLSLDDSYDSCVTIKAKTVKDLHEILISRISTTKENISEIEKNVRTLEFNDLLAEVTS